MDHVETTSRIVAAYVAKNRIAPDELATILTNVHHSLVAIGQEKPKPIVENRPIPPMPWKKSIRPDGIVSFEDGRVYQTLKRHLGKRGLTMDEYKKKWGLPYDYPSVSPDYSKRRSALALERGLGKNPEPTEPEVEAAPKLVIEAKPKHTTKAKAEPEAKASPKRVRSFPKSEQTRKRGSKAAEQPHSELEAA